VGPLPPAGEPCQSSIKRPASSNPPQSPGKPATSNVQPATATSPDSQPLVAPTCRAEGGRRRESDVGGSEEHCLECGTLLPALLANGDRPQELCENCGEMLGKPGIYWKPS